MWPETIRVEQRADAAGYSEGDAELSRVTECHFRLQFRASSGRHHAADYVRSKGVGCNTGGQSGAEEAVGTELEQLSSVQRAVKRNLCICPILIT